jgi:aromatic-L-amino-acid decarboxylase
MERLNAEGHIYLTHTKLNGRLTLRFCVGQVHTQEQHVIRAWKRILEMTDKLERGR